MDDLNVSAILDDLMTGPLEAIADVFERVAEAAEQVAEAVSASMDDAAAATEAYQAGLDDLSASVDSLAGSMDAAAASLDANTESLDANTEALGENAAASGDAAAASDANGGSLKGIASGFGLAGLAALAAGGAMVVMGAKTEDALTQIAALTGASKPQMAQYTQGLEDMSQQLGVSMTDAANGLYYVISAGFQGGAAMNVLQVAMEAAKAGGAQMQTVADALTSALNGYGASASQAGNYSDIMVEAVTQGKQSFADFAGAIGMAAVTGHTAGFSFAEVAAAEATMTQTGLDAHRSVMELDFLMRSIGLSADAVAQKAQKLGIEGFDTAAFSSDTLIQKLQYLQQITNGNKSAFETLVGGANGLSAAELLLGKNGDTYNGILTKMQHSAGATQQAFEVSEASMSAHLGHLGGSFSVAAYKFEQFVAPAVNGAMDKLTSVFAGFASLITGDGGATVAILGALAAVVAGGLTLALYAAGAAFVAAAMAEGSFLLPILAVTAAVALLVGGVILLYTHWAPFREAVGAAGQALGDAVAVLRELWSALAAQLLPMLEQLGARLQSELAPAWAELTRAFNEAKPVLQIIAIALGGVLVTAIGLLVGALGGLAMGLVSLISGAAQFFAGLIQTASGFVALFVDLWSGLFKILQDLFTGNWSKLGADTHTWLTNMGADIEQIGLGIWHMLQGLWQAGVGTVIAIVQGFVGGVIAWFTSLWDELVGHSIIPDMINGIISWFQQLPGRAVAEVQTLAAQLVAEFASLEQQGVTWGRNLIQGFITGIQNMAGNVGSAAQGIAQHVASFLGFHSPAEQGPGATADQWMPNLGRMLAQGLTAQTGPVGQAAGQLAGALAAPFGLTSGPSGISGSIGGLGGAPSVAALSGAGGGGASFPSTIHVHLHDETGAGGFSTGLRLLDPTIRQQLAQELAQEMFKQGSAQGRQPYGYTGSK